MGEINLHQDPNLELMDSSARSSGRGDAGDYIITHYSLPKALVGFRSTNASSHQQQASPNDPDPMRSVSQQREVRRQQILRNKFNAVKSYDSRAPKNGGELEQFHYEQDF